MWQKRLLKLIVEDCGCMPKYEPPKDTFNERKFIGDGLAAIHGKITKHSDGYKNARLEMSDEFGGVKTLFTAYGETIKDRKKHLKELENFISDFRKKLDESKVNEGSMGFKRLKRLANSKKPKMALKSAKLDNNRFYKDLYKKSNLKNLAKRK